MLFGKSVFQSILTRLDHELPDESEAAAADAANVVSARVSGLPAGFVAPIEVSESEQRAGDAYRALQAEFAEDLRDDPTIGMTIAAGPGAGPGPSGAPPTPEEPSLPPRFERLTPAEVAEDLGLLPTDDADTLAEKRRRFARENHPDSVDAALRQRATIRMTLANMAVDEALRIAETSDFFARPAKTAR